MSKTIDTIKDAIIKTFPAIEEVVDMNDWVTKETQRGARVKKFREYADGEHDAKITDQMAKLLNIFSAQDEAKLDEFNINHCDAIVQTMVDRLHVNSIRSTDEKVTEWVNENLLIPNRFEAMQGATYEGAVRDGDSYIMSVPRFDKNKVFLGVDWSIEPAFDGNSGVIIMPSGNGKPMLIAKAWSINQIVAGDSETSVEQVYSVFVYVPGQIYKYKGTLGALTLEDTENTGLPIPFVQYSNQLSRYNYRGKSEIKDVIPAQNALNRSLHSLVFTSDIAAFGIRIAVGFDIEGDITPGAVIPVVIKDNEGNTVYELDESQVNYLKAVKLLEFTAAEVTPYIEEAKFLKSQIYEVTRTPEADNMGSSTQSGEALKQREIGLVGKSTRFQHDNGEAWEDLIRLSSVIWNKFATNKSPVIENLSVIWKDAELRNDAQSLENITKIKDKVDVFPNSFYRSQIGAILGISSKDIEKLGEEFDENNLSALRAIIRGGGEDEIPIL